MNGSQRFDCLQLENYSIVDEHVYPVGRVYPHTAILEGHRNADTDCVSPGFELDPEDVE